MGKYEMEGKIIFAFPQETLCTLVKVSHSPQKLACKIIAFLENLPRIVSFLQFVSNFVSERKSI